MRLIKARATGGPRQLGDETWTCAASYRTTSVESDMNHSPADAAAQLEPNEARHAAAPNPIRALQAFGQSVWLDYLRRSLFTSGEFKRLIAEDGLRGVTSNPSIFEKAIAGSTDYLNALQDIERRGDMEPMALYQALAIRRHPRSRGSASPGL